MGVLGGLVFSYERGTPVHQGGVIVSERRGGGVGGSAATGHEKGCVSDTFV